MIGNCEGGPNPLEVNLNKMTPAERAQWSDKNSLVEVVCITRKCGDKAKTTKEYANRITNIHTGRVEYLCGRCLHRRALEELTEQAVQAEMEKQRTEQAQAEEKKYDAV